MTTREFQDRLARRARRAALTMSPELAAALETYFRLLATWNQKINLSGLTLDDPTPEAFDRLLVEPLVAAKHVPSGTTRIIDIGSGGGSPAIPLTLALRGAHVLMVESKTRKSVFLREATRTLGMQAEVATSRWEALLSRPDLHEAHDVLTIRAVRVEARILMGLQAFVKPGGQLLLFRGAASGDTADALTPPLIWRGTFPLLESLRSKLIVLEKRRSRR